jgi:hypothetical protein
MSTPDHSLSLAPGSRQAASSIASEPLAATGANFGADTMKRAGGIKEEEKRKRLLTWGAGMAVCTTVLVGAIVAIVVLLATGVLKSKANFGNTIQAKSTNTVTGASPIPEVTVATGDQIPRQKLASQAVALSMAYLEAQRAGAAPSDTKAAAPQVHATHILCSVGAQMLTRPSRTCSLAMQACNLELCAATMCLQVRVLRRLC